MIRQNSDGYMKERNTDILIVGGGTGALCEFTQLPLPQIRGDETRSAIDRIVTESLGLQPEIVATIHRELSREPSVTGKPNEV